MDLKSLSDDQLVELQTRIKAAQQQRAEEETARRRIVVLNTYGVQVICPVCMGSGNTPHVDYDGHASDDLCHVCTGKGYIWAPKYARDLCIDRSWVKVFVEWDCLESLA
jgi:DnaJ-class molecular chaperone